MEKTNSLSCLLPASGKNPWTINLFLSYSSLLLATFWNNNFFVMNICNNEDKIHKKNLAIRYMLARLYSQINIKPLLNDFGKYH